MSCIIWGCRSEETRRFIMKKILYITFFCLNILDIYSMNTNNIRELTTELPRYQTLCHIIGRAVEGYFGIAACYVNEAMQVREGKDSELGLDSLLDNAIYNFLQARQKMDNSNDIDTYFSKNIYSVNNAEQISFLSYLRSSGHAKCTVEDTKKSIWNCYLKNRTLDKKYYDYYASLATTENKSPVERKKGYLWCAAYYINEAIQVREGKNSELSLDLLLYDAATNLCSAKKLMTGLEEIDTYFSTNRYFESSSEYKSFSSYLLDNRRPNASDSQDNDLTITVEDTKKAIWDYYLKNRTLDKEYFESLIKSDNPLEKRKEGYFGLAAYYLNGVINDARGQTSLSETHNSNLKTASGNFIVAFNYLDRTFDKVKKYKEVDKYFSKKCFIDLYDEIQVKYYDFANAIQQAAQQARLSIFQITEDHIFKLMLKVYFGVDYKEGWWCLIM